MMTFRRFPGLLGLDGLDPMAGMGAVEGSDANHGPDDLLPPESLVTHSTVPTAQWWYKRFGRPAGGPR